MCGCFQSCLPFNSTYILLSSTNIFIRENSIRRMKRGDCSTSNCPATAPKKQLDPTMIYLCAISRNPNNTIKSRSGSMEPQALLRQQFCSWLASTLFRVDRRISASTSSQILFSPVRHFAQLYFTGNSISTFSLAFQRLKNIIII